MQSAAGHGTSKEHPHQKKMSSALIVFVACVVGLAIGLFSLNYWHTSRCATERSAAELDEMIDSLHKRLLESESMVQKNQILLNKVIAALQTNLYKLEQKEYEELLQQSKDEAVRISLYLAGHPAPPMPLFPMDVQYDDPEKLADVIDDIFSKSDLEKEGDYLESGEEVMEETIDLVTDAEALQICTEWRDKYHVTVGVSWGDLPYDLQQKWLKYSCDYHLKD